MNDSPGSTADAVQAQLDECRAEVSRLRLLVDVQATIDMATGMLNAQGMLEPLQTAMDRLGRTGESFAVCIVDLPQLADREQELTDGAMRHAGALLGATLRGMDRVGRLGNSSFLVVMPQMVFDAVGDVLGRIGSSIGLLPYETDEGPIDLEPVFTVLLNPESPVEPETLLDSVAEARAGAAPGAPSIVRSSD